MDSIYIVVKNIKKTRTINQAKIGSVNRLSSRTCTSSISCILCAIYIILLYIRIKGQIIINWKIVGLFFLPKNTKTSAQQLPERRTRGRNVYSRPSRNRLMEGTYTSLKISRSCVFKKYYLLLIMYSYIELVGLNVLETYFF